MSVIFQLKNKDILYGPTVWSHINMHGKFLPLRSIVVRGRIEPPARSHFLGASPFMFNLVQYLTNQTEFCTMLKPKCILLPTRIHRVLIICQKDYFHL